jgi:hypothetical protein
VPIQSGRKDPRVIKDDQVPRLEQVRKLSKGTVLELTACPR